MGVEESDEAWADIPPEARFGYLWPALVDLLKEMGVPFVLTAQFTMEDKQRPVAFHLAEGMDPRIVLAAILARDGVNGLSKVLPGLGKVERLDMTQPEVVRKTAQWEAGDVRMEQIKLPHFMDSMRDIEEDGEELEEEKAIKP